MKIELFVLAALIVLVVGCSQPAMPTSGPGPARTASAPKASGGDDCLASCNSAPPSMQETCRYTCIGKMAIDKKDPGLCNQLSDENMKAMCVQNANAAAKGE